MWWLIYGGVFDRHPGLKLMITETPGNWYPGLAKELDAGWQMFAGESEMNAAFFKRCPRPPSEYMYENVFLGASFASAHEAGQAVVHGFEAQLSWGSDYPHVEGTYLNPEGTTIRRMVGQNAIDLFGLDKSKLANVAARIEAPTMEALRTPIDRDMIPSRASNHAFRSGDTGWS